MDEKELSLITSTNIDCRPTCLSLLDTSQFAKPQESTQVKSTEKQKAARLAARIEALESLRPRSYVSIEYDENENASEALSNGDASDYESDPSSFDSDQSDEEEQEIKTAKKQKRPNAKSKEGPSVEIAKRKKGMPDQTYPKRAKKAK